MDSGAASSEEMQGFGLLLQSQAENCREAEKQTKDVDGGTASAGEVTETKTQCHTPGAVHASVSIQTFLRPTPRHYFTASTGEIQARRQAFINQAKSQQGQAESNDLDALTPVSVRLQLCRNRQDQIRAYRHHCLTDYPVMFAARSIPLDLEDIIVPPEPFPHARESLEAVVELL